ncbi:hypothetical protein EDM56_10500 [Brevibacillus fluminis]|uniref:Uncharacterized protein n=1 Tax=Brevibacillus fluminis TaxID=511487 RepID=A0A3M8DQ18_9BACL|nr:hypothetical protein [Brevibacillus fluminis]RNB89609.1 hypothetical protein EDM56_10500 [Brevibacillus fluminis]
MSFYEKIKGIFLLGILICFIVIAQKPDPSFSYNSPAITIPDIPDSSNASVIQLDKNKIAFVDTRNGSRTFGKIIVLEFNETTKRFTQVASYTASFDMEFQ